MRFLPAIRRPAKRSSRTSDRHGGSFAETVRAGVATAMDKRKILTAKELAPSCRDWRGGGGELAQNKASRTFEFQTSSTDSLVNRLVFI